MDSVIKLILNISVWGVAKLLVLIALLIYLIFAAVVVRQICLMTQVVSGELDLPIKIAAWLHFFFAIFIILLAVVIL